MTFSCPLVCDSWIRILQKPFEFRFTHSWIIWPIYEADLQWKWKDSQEWFVRSIGSSLLYHDAVGRLLSADLYIFPNPVSPAFSSKTNDYLRQKCPKIFTYKSNIKLWFAKKQGDNNVYYVHGFGVII